MKNHISLMLLLLFVPFTGMAQRGIGIRDLRMVQSRDGIILDFTLDAGSKATAAGATLTLTPTLVKGGRSRELPAVVVRGRRAEILDRRSAIAEGASVVTIPGTGAMTIRNGERTEYRTSITFEDWMPGAKLVLRGESMGCATTETLVGTLADGVIVPAADFTATEQVVIPGPILSTADKLVQHFPFVQPVPAGGGYGDAPHSSRVSRMEGGLTIFFHQGRDNVVPDYRENYRSLVDLLSVIEEIRRSADSEIDRIAITGFASPEGNHEANVRLSRRRAEAMRRVIVQNSPSLASMIRVYAGGEDWDGLGELVAASSIPNKEEIMRAIDLKNKNELMRLDGGEVYRRMERTLFPELREATFIIVYYKNKTQ